MPDHDSIHGHCFKKFTSIHDRLAIEINRCLQETHWSKWMTEGKTILIQKDPQKGQPPTNADPPVCLTMMWKIRTAQIKEEIYYSLINYGIFPKGCHHGIRETVDLLYIEEYILKNSNTRRKNTWDFREWTPSNKGRWKEKLKKEYLRGTRKLQETKLSGKNFINGINTYTVPLIRYSGPFLKWTREELHEMEQRIRKLISMHKALHLKDDVERLSRKEDGRKFTSIQIASMHQYNGSKTT